MREVHGPRNAVVVGGAPSAEPTPLDQAQQLYFSLVGAERQLDGVKIWRILVAVGMRVG